MIDHHLARCVVEVIITADYMGHAHIMIVDHHRQHINGRPVRAEQHHVVQLIILNGDIALHPVADHGRAVLRCLDPDHKGRVRVRVWGRIPPGRPEKRAAPFGFGGVAECGNFFGGGKTLVRLALCQQIMGDLCMPVGIGELADDIAVVIQTQPRHALQDRLGRFRGRSRPVRVFDPQQKPAAIAPRKEPVEQRRAGAANMQKAGRRRGKTGHNRRRHRRKVP